MEIEEGRQYGARRFDLRVVTDALEFDCIGIRNQFAISLHQMFAGNGIIQSVNKAQRNFCVLHRAQPALTVFAAFRYVLQKPVSQFLAAIERNQVPEIGQVFC